MSKDKTLDDILKEANELINNSSNPDIESARIQIAEENDLDPSQVSVIKIDADSPEDAIRQFVSKHLDMEYDNVVVLDEMTEKLTNILKNDADEDKVSKVLEDVLEFNKIVLNDDKSGPAEMGDALGKLKEALKSKIESISDVKQTITDDTEEAVVLNMSMKDYITAQACVVYHTEQIEEMEKLASLMDVSLSEAIYITADGFAAQMMKAKTKIDAKD